MTNNDEDDETRPQMAEVCPEVAPVPLDHLRRGVRLRDIRGDGRARGGPLRLHVEGVLRSVLVLQRLRGAESVKTTVAHDPDARAQDIRLPEANHTASLSQLVQKRLS